MADRIQLRRDTRANWEAYNPILLEGEQGYLLDDPNLYKMGDGIHAWNDLPWRGYDGNILQEMQDGVTNAVPSSEAVLKFYGRYKDNPEWVYAVIDSDGKVLFGIKLDGKFYADIAGLDEKLKIIVNEFISYIQEAEATIDEKMAKFDELFEIIDNPEYISVEFDSDGRVLGGRKSDGTKFEEVGFETPDISIGGNKHYNSHNIEDKIELKTDALGKILSYRDKRGILHEEAGIDTEKISLSEEGYKELKDALNITEPEQSQGIEKIGDGVLDGNVCIDYYNPYSDLDMENMLKLKGNLHGHTTYSDSEITPENYMIKYREAGYDFAAITDHDNYENGHLVPEYADHIAPDPEVEGIIYMGPCYEDTATTQHINVYQIPEFLGFKGSRTANEVFRKGSLEKGRLCCLNHPNWGSQFLSNDYILNMEKIFNFVELWNGSIGTTESSTEKGNSWAGACRAWDILLSSGHKVFGLAVDDYHLLPNHSENLMFRRGYVEVYSKGRTAIDVYRALAQGRFVACNALGTDNTIEITAIDCSDGKYHVELAEACDIYFFGVNGSILQENLSVTSATYTLDGTEKYVRCAIKKNLEYKWLQPLIRKSTKRTFNL